MPLLRRLNKLGVRFQATQDQFIRATSTYTTNYLVKDFFTHILVSCLIVSTQCTEIPDLAALLYDSC